MSINVVQVSSVTGGLNPFHLASGASTNANVIKSGAGQVYGWAITNTNAAIRYICFHDSLKIPTAGNAIYFKYGIPASGASNQAFDFGIQFSNGIAITTVVNAIDSDATSVAANDLIINIFYK